MNAPHMEWPLRFVETDDGTVSVAEVEQGTTQEFLRGLGLACEVRVDQLAWDEEFGIPDPIGATDLDALALEIEAALKEIDPRFPIAVTVIERPGPSRVLRLAVLAVEGETVDEMEVALNAD